MGSEGTAKGCSEAPHLSSREGFVIRTVPGLLNVRRSCLKLADWSWVNHSNTLFRMTTSAALSTSEPTVRGWGCLGCYQPQGISWEGRGGGGGG